MRKFNSFNQSALTEYTALRECFGSELRSRTLGQRHVDKGVYVDQLDRWMRVFPSDNFFIFTLEQWNIDPHHIFQQLLLFIGVSERGAGIFESSNNTHANHNRSRRSIVLEMMKDTVRSIKHQWDTIRRNTSIVSPNIESKFEYTDSRNHTQLIDFSHQRLVRPNRLSQEPMPESLKHKLIKFYTPHNTRLVELLTDVVRKGK